MSVLIYCSVFIKEWKIWGHGGLNTISLESTGFFFPITTLRKLAPTHRGASRAVSHSSPVLAQPSGQMKISSECGANTPRGWAAPKGWRGGRTAPRRGGLHFILGGLCEQLCVCDWYFLGLVIDEYLENDRLWHFINVENCGLGVLVQILILKV